MTPLGTDAVIVGPTDDPRQLPGMNKALYPTSPKAGDAPPTKKAAPRINPALLEQMMKNRNARP